MLNQGHKQGTDVSQGRMDSLLQKWKRIYGPSESHYILGLCTTFPFFPLSKIRCLRNIKQQFKKCKENAMWLTAVQNEPDI